MLVAHTRYATVSIDRNDMHVSHRVISHIMHFPSICHFPPSFNIDDMRGKLGCARTRQVRMRDCGVALRARKCCPRRCFKAKPRLRCMVEAWWGALLAPNTLELRQWKDIISCWRTVEEGGVDCGVSKNRTVRSEQGMSVISGSI